MMLKPYLNFAWFMMLLNLVFDCIMVPDVMEPIIVLGSDVINLEW